MNNFKFIILVGTFLIVTVSCEDKPEYIPPKAQLVHMTTITQEVNLPSRLWEEMEALYKPLIFDKAATENEGDSKAKLESPKDYFAFHVYLKEKTPGILNNRNGYDLSFSAGGGLLNFQDYLQNRKGSFYFGFKPELQIQKDDIFKVYYLSNAKVVSIDKEPHGAGCDKYMDVSDYFRSKMAKEGILLNTTEGRHIALMAGTYFFATSLKGKLYLSQLTIRDSRFKKSHCNWK
jgi:hypothetical protein